ncbi:MAG: DUF1987 domain-containing protein [Desulfohalobiaceae bacterium]|nr:DUF1987 domain-containing protein [Desulfohalobiaceae bacterium]
MEPYIREKTKSTPLIQFDPENHYLELKGESYPENSSKFYTPMLEWLEKYLSGVSQESIRADIELIYFNSSSSKVFMNFFDMLEDAAQNGVTVVVNWKYHVDNDSALECGEEFYEDMEQVVFNMVELQDEK